MRVAFARFDESPEDFYRQVMTGSMLFQGLTDQTMQHDQRWHFTQLGKYLERIDVTSRVIATKFALLKSNEAKLEAPADQMPILGGRRGHHSEHLGHLLAVMQFLPRTYPDATW